jgi:hypothetical protein
MILKPKERLTAQEVDTGLKLILKEGLTTEAMTTLTGGTFLVAFALLLGANNFQIGLLASLPTFTNIFQLTSIWLVRRYNNRRAVSVICSVLGADPVAADRLVTVRFSRPCAGQPAPVFPLFLLSLRIYRRAELECLDERPRPRGDIGDLFLEARTLFLRSSM